MNDEIKTKVKKQYKLISLTLGFCAFFTAMASANAQITRPTAQPPRLLRTDGYHIDLEGLAGLNISSGRSVNTIPSENYGHLAPLFLVRGTLTGATPAGPGRLTMSLGYSQSRALARIGGYLVFMDKDNRYGLVIGSTRLAHLAPNTIAIQILPVGVRRQFANGFLHLEAFQGVLFNNNGDLVQAATGAGIAGELRGNRLERTAFSLYFDVQAAMTYGGSGANYFNLPSPPVENEESPEAMPTYTVVDVTQSGLGLYLQTTAGLSFPINRDIAFIFETSVTFNGHNATASPPNSETIIPNSIRNFDLSGSVGLRGTIDNTETPIYEEPTAPSSVDPNNHTPHPPGASAE